MSSTSTTPTTEANDYSSQMGSAEAPLEGAILTVICLTAITANVSLWLVVLTTRDLRTESNVLILSLSFADLLVSTVSMPITVATILTARWQFSQLTCTAIGYLNMITFTASVQSLGVISVNRYMKICRPNKFADIYTFRNVLLMCVGVWLLSGALSLPPLFGWGVYDYLPYTSLCFCDWSTSLSYATFMIAACFFLPCTAMMICYVSILRTFFQSKRTLQAFAVTNGDAHSSKVSGQVSEGSEGASQSVVSAEPPKTCPERVKSSKCTKVILEHSPVTAVALKRMEAPDDDSKWSNHASVPSNTTAIINHCGIENENGSKRTLHSSGHSKKITFGLESKMEYKNEEDDVVFVEVTSGLTDHQNENVEAPLHPDKRHKNDSDRSTGLYSKVNAVNSSLYEKSAETSRESSSDHIPSSPKRLPSRRGSTASSSRHNSASEPPSGPGSDRQRSDKTSFQPSTQFLNIDIEKETSTDVGYKSVSEVDEKTGEVTEVEPCSPIPIIDCLCGQCDEKDCGFLFESGARSSSEGNPSDHSIKSAAAAWVQSVPGSCGDENRGEKTEKRHPHVFPEADPAFQPEMHKQRNDVIEAGKENEQDAEEFSCSDQAVRHAASSRESSPIGQHLLPDDDTSQENKTSPEKPTALENHAPLDNRSFPLRPFSEFETDLHLNGSIHSCPQLKKTPDFQLDQGIRESRKSVTERENQYPLLNNLNRQAVISPGTSKSSVSQVDRDNKPTVDAPTRQRQVFISRGNTSIPGALNNLSSIPEHLHSSTSHLHFSGSDKQHHNIPATSSSLPSLCTDRYYPPVSTSGWDKSENALSFVNVYATSQWSRIKQTFRDVSFLESHKIQPNNVPAHTGLNKHFVPRLMKSVSKPSSNDRDAKVTSTNRDQIMPRHPGSKRNPFIHIHLTRPDSDGGNTDGVQKQDKHQRVSIGKQNGTLLRVGEAEAERGGGEGGGGEGGGRGGGGEGGVGRVVGGIELGGAGGAIVEGIGRGWRLTKKKFLAPPGPIPKKRTMSRSDRRRREEYQLSASLLVVIVIFIICWFPYCVSMFVSLMSPSSSTRALDMTSILLGYLNSCVNPIVYGLMNRRFKAGYRRLFARLRCGRNHLLKIRNRVWPSQTGTSPSHNS